MPKPILYRGRFAPSPSGSMHFGSLVAALGSYLQARSQHGFWQVRIDDIDPPREVKGAAQDILLTLQAYGLNWDGDVIYQSHNSQSYENALGQLTEQQLCYACACSRKMIRKSHGLYQGTCRYKQLPEINNALRINLHNMIHPVTHFDDQLQGKVVLDKKQASEDFIVRRKEGLYAYNLATVIDDINQGITEIVRGADLLTTTGKQLTLYQLLNKKTPTYLHLPVAVTAPGNKLSKQNHALAISKDNPTPTLLAALNFLGHTVPQEIALKSCSAILKWAIQNWSPKKLPQLAEIQIKN